jgi:hypothetical protein
VVENKQLMWMSAKTKRSTTPATTSTAITITAVTLREGDVAQQQ